MDAGPRLNTRSSPTPDPRGGAEPEEPPALLGEAAVLIWNDVVREGRERFFRWHDREHIPERLALPGFRRGRRFIRPGHSPEWLTMYETDDIAAASSPEYLARLNNPTPGTIDTLTYFRNTSRAVCTLACSTGSSTGGHALALRLEVASAGVDTVVRRFRDDLFPAAMALTGVVACHLFVSDHWASHEQTKESSTRTFDVPSGVVLVEATSDRAAEQARTVVEVPQLVRMGVVVREDSAVYALEICRLAAFQAPASPRQPRRPAST